MKTHASWMAVIAVNLFMLGCDSEGPSSAGLNENTLPTENDRETKPTINTLDAEANTVPEGNDIACGNESLPFAPPFALDGPSPEDAYWMMWFARRASFFGQPELPQELATLGFDDYVEISNNALGLQSFVASNGERVVLSFLGSEEVTDWLVNVSFAQTRGKPHGLPGRIHVGFITALNAAWEPLVEALEARTTEGQEIWITGHSLGGAMATLAAVRLSDLGFTVAPVYVFGQPRVGNQTFAEGAQEQLDGQFFRFVNDRDVVPRIPPSGDAAAQAAAVLPFGGPFFEWVIGALNYAHLGTMHHLVDDEVLVYPAMDDGEDVAYWDELDSEGWFALLSATQVGTWHRHDAYLCKLRQWAFGL